MPHPYQWMEEYLLEHAEVRAVSRRTERRVAGGVRTRRTASVQVLRLYLELQQHPMTVEQIMADFGACRRTVYNWLGSIQLAGIELRAEQNPEVSTDRAGQAKHWRAA